MAQYNPTIALGQLKGSIGGTTFQGGNNSSIIRNKTYRKGQPSDSRNLATSSIQEFATTWRNLGSADRASWNALAVTYPFLNKFGVVYYASGYQVFVSLNSYARSIGIGSFTVAPTAFAPASMGVFSTNAWDTNTMIINWTITPSVSTYLKIFGVHEFSPGRNLNHLKWKQFLYGGAVNAVGTTTIDVDALYSYYFGKRHTGQLCAIRLEVCDPAYPFPYFPTVISQIIL